MISKQSNEPVPARRSARPSTVRTASAIALALAGCGDDLVDPDDGPAIERVDTLFVTAHSDDDIIFMQPELTRALQRGSLTTIYVTSGDPVHGDDHADYVFAGARIAYSSIAGPVDWDCGYLSVNDAPVHHCRLRGTAISIIALDIADGGIEGDGPVSTLKLAQGEIDEIPILGPIGGTATQDSITDTLGALITTIAPTQIHTLDLAADHGYDHSSHLFASSFVFWAAARIGYAGAIRWHRGYNVRDEPITLGAMDYAPARQMVAYYDACYFRNLRCGALHTTVDETHDRWLQRQYSYDRAPLDAGGTLAPTSDPARCVAATGGTLALGDCATAPAVELDATGHLRIGDACLASPPGAAEPVALAACDDTPAQYWISDSKGRLWNGRRPDPGPDMFYDHVRCLDAEPSPGAALTAPVCGWHRAPAWQFSQPR